MTKDEAKQKIANLCKKYDSLSPAAIKGYNEAATKLGFIEPMFRALGWDIEDKNEVAPEYEVSNKRVDYAFKLHDVSRFYVEAKSLKADLTNADYIKQAVTYAYNKGVTWAILTDFHQLRLFNSQTGKVWLTLNYTDYLSGFDKLWLLSKESLSTGLLDKEATQNGVLPTRIPIETRLFRQLREWRGILFNELHLYNEKLTFRQIDEVIQKLFDRLIFIRTAEDRGIEERLLRSMVNQWKSSGHKGELVEEIRKIFRDFDGYYDSDLFARHMVDDVFIMGTTIQAIIDGLYEIPGGLTSYDFSVMPADVLGAVYEQYLGYVAEIEKQRAKQAQAKLDLGIQTETITLTEKRERRKEQGIYYTPSFITDYIVKETVGRFLAERSATEIRNIKILDPACGSGSFLIRAFDELLKYYADQKISKSETDIDAADRISLLTNNIFGVDLDLQAVEIARLNLLLRSLAKRDLLPSLKDNIRQGNSLISGTEEKFEKYLGKTWRDKKPFDWEQKFKEIMDSGGFDAVIGNPPYAGFQGVTDKDYLKANFNTAKGRFDIYIPFVELGLRILKTGGLLGFICPTNFMKRGHGEALRKFIKSKSLILEIVDFKDIQIFQEALNYTGIIILRKGAPPNSHKLLYKAESIAAPPQEFRQANLDDELWSFPNQRVSKVISAIQNNPVEPLEKLCNGISEGIVTGKNEVFIVPAIEAQQLGLEDNLTHPILQGKDIRRYTLAKPQNVVIYPYKNSKKKTVPFTEHEMMKNYPNTFKYLGSKRKDLNGRSYFNASNKFWYELWCERSFADQGSEKIVVAEIAEANRFAPCPDSWFYLDTACGFTLMPGFKSSYILGILNSKLLTFFYKNTTVPKANQFFIYKTMFLKRLPIRRIDFNNLSDKNMHDDLVALVKRILELNSKLSPVVNTFDNNRDVIRTEIEKTDKEIDNLVYDLYGLTEEERVIVEGPAN